MEANNHALGFASEADIRAALDDSDSIIEWETIGFTFVRSSRHLVIVRSGALGGDVRTVHGGWKFANIFQLEMAWREIRAVANCFSPTIRVPARLLEQATMRVRR